MKEHNLTPPAGARHRRKRLGRGDQSGHGSYSGKGMKGQKARTGGGVRPGFEGGQLPLIKRMPHTRGFVNPFRREYAVVNVGSLDRFPDGSEVTPRELYLNGLVRNLHHPIKVLGDGEISRPLTVRVHRVSGSAQAKIEQAGGRVETLRNA